MESELKVVLHAPSAAALQRARNNALNLKRGMPTAEVCIIANAQAVEAALDVAHDLLDAATWICPISLERLNRDNRSPLQVLPGSAVLEIARMQVSGWVYIRA
ncbi:hypothetical protein [Achromobacter mucicolens]|uniref:hypothetical protein n=1 Tax=Achromobacter mucicolens TaxID=1389922 RepID=UPI00158288B7|nr:hypothetical protein [Achromobacter mucicolens]